MLSGTPERLLMSASLVRKSRRQMRHERSSKRASGLRKLATTLFSKNPFPLNSAGFPVPEGV